MIILESPNDYIRKVWAQLPTPQIKPKVVSFFQNHSYILINSAYLFGLVVNHEKQGCLSILRKLSMTQFCSCHINQKS